MFGVFVSVRKAHHHPPSTPQPPALPCPGLAPPPQEAPLEAFLANLTDSLALPAGAFSLGALQEAPPSTADLAVAEAGSGATRRLAQAQAEAAAEAAPAGAPTYLTATISLDPESAADLAGSGQFSAAWMQAALDAAAAQQGSASPVQLEGGEVTR